MDPVTIVGLVEGSISLAVQCGSVAKNLNNIAGQYKYAKLTLSTMVQNLDIMQFAWDRIAVWSKHHVFTENDSLKGRLERFLETGFMVLDALEEDLRSYDASRLTFHQRSRLVWNEGTLQAHQTRVRDQAQSMNLFLQAVQLPTIQGTADLLQQSQKQFIKSDESAFSIVPSRMSSRVSLSTTQTGDRYSVRSSASLEYCQFTFENELFTARVYKRNYRTSKYQGSRKQNGERDVKAVAPRKGNPPCSELADSSILYQTLAVRDRNVSMDRKYREFIRACRKGDKDEVGKLLKTASTYGDIKAVILLLRHKCSSVYVCPIHNWIFDEYLDVIETLLQYGHWEHGSVYREDPRSPLFCTGRYVMAHGHKQPSIPPLHVAAYKGHLSMVQLLLRMGAPISAESDHGVQAIHLAAKIGSIKVLRILIAAGASVNCKDHKGRQPMHYLSKIQRPKVIQYLAGKGAEIDGVSYTSEITPLGFACRKGIDANAKALLSLGALVTSPILDAAVNNGPSSMVETLVISATSQREGQSIVVASLRKFLSNLLLQRVRIGYEDGKKLSFLLKYTDLLVKAPNGNTFLHDLNLFFWLKLPQVREVFGSGEEFLKQYLSDHTRFSSDEIRSIVSYEKRFLALLERDFTDASASMDPLFGHQEKEACSENWESRSTDESASSDTSREQSPASPIRHVHSTSEENLSIEAALPREYKAFIAFIRSSHRQSSLGPMINGR